MEQMVVAIFLVALKIGNKPRLAIASAAWQVGKFAPPRGRIPTRLRALETRITEYAPRLFLTTCPHVIGPLICSWHCVCMHAE